MSSPQPVELRIADINDVACPICGRAVTGYETEQPLKYLTEPVELGEGGPIIEPRHFSEPTPTGSPITTLTPCGHRVNLIVWTKEALEQQKRTWH